MIRRETVHVEVNDATIAANDPAAVIHPVWWRARIYDGPIAYEKSLEQFSRSQRLIWAIHWYRSEVNNGGHRQFFSNSTGIVWRDALDGFEAIGAARAANIVKISADRLGGSPSLDWQERQDQLDSHEPNFRDLDDSFYDFEKKSNLDELMLEFIRARPSDFYFSGTIERVVLPKFPSATKNYLLLPTNG